jgi:hypothetical protein
MAIIDVDFRWVERKVRCGEFYELDSNSMQPAYRDEKVLQWRKKVLVTKQDRYFPDVPKQEWTDWQDVRTEEE